MSYIIDGHNLIPHIPGLSLDQVDDEVQLITLLQEFVRKRRTQVNVFFDKAPAGNHGSQKYGQVHAFFVREGLTADSAIQARLKQLGKKAKNVIVVTSDQAVQTSARYYRARVMSSEMFARLLLPEGGISPPEPGKNPDIQVDPGEVDYWLDVFKNKGKK
jgi:uncharacterized protein